MAAMELNGAVFRYLPTTEYTEAYFQGGLFVHREYLETHQGQVCAYVQVISKGVELVLDNPEAAIHIHWKVYPESKPRGFSEDEALKFSLEVLKSRMNKWDPSDELV
jgi:NitT/TauT family transport system substrate-binding protein